MTEVRALDMMLHNRRVRTITEREGDPSIFTFSPSRRIFVAGTNRHARPVLQGTL